MIPQLGAPIGLFVAAAVFAFLLNTLKMSDFLDWGWRYPFFVAFVINVVALFARLRLISTPEFQELFESRELQPSPVTQMFGRRGAPWCSAPSPRSPALRYFTSSPSSRSPGWC